MQISSNYITQNRIFSGTGMIAGVSLPNYDDSLVYTKTKTKTSDSEYRKAIVEQAIKDQAAGKFQGDSEDFLELQKNMFLRFLRTEKELSPQDCRKLQGTILRR